MGAYECGNELLSSLNCGEFLGEAENSLAIQKGLYSME